MLFYIRTFSSIIIFSFIFSSIFKQNYILKFLVIVWLVHKYRTSSKGQQNLYHICCGKTKLIDLLLCNVPSNMESALSYQQVSGRGLLIFAGRLQNNRLTCTTIRFDVHDRSQPLFGEIGRIKVNIRYLWVKSCTLRTTLQSSL